MTAVVAGEQSRGVGYALKCWQRAICLEHGIAEVRWTPLRDHPDDLAPMLEHHVLPALVRQGFTKA